jgi:spoIIIJ-associated protein
MDNGVIVTGETIEEALNKGLNRLNVDNKEDIEYEVLQEPAEGFLNIFGAQRAKVSISKKKSKVARAYEFIEELLSEMGLGFEVELLENNTTQGEAIFNISGEDLGIIIGHRGKTLDALQYLVNLAVNKGEEDYLRVILDAEGYRNRRRKTLEHLAKKMGNKAKKKNRKVKLDPMPPHERRIIHTTLQDMPRVSTYSEGEDPNRRVVIVTD